MQKFIRFGWTFVNFGQFQMLNKKLCGPKIAPIALIDPIHDSWSSVNGPVFNGVWLDESNSVAGESQPIMHPWLKKTKFAIK